MLICLCYMLLDASGCCWMLLNAVRCGWMRLDDVRCCWVSRGVGCHWTALDVIGRRWMSLDVVGRRWMSLDGVERCCMSLNGVGCHWTMLHLPDQLYLCSCALHPRLACRTRQTSGWVYKAMVNTTSDPLFERHTNHVSKSKHGEAWDLKCNIASRKTQHIPTAIGQCGTRNSGWTQPKSPLCVCVKPTNCATLHE